LLGAWLRSRGHTVTECTDPGGTPTGDQIRALLLDHRQEMSVLCEMLLFMASRADLTAAVIRPALETGHVVIADRFLLANVVYQGHSGGLDPDRIWEVGRLATGGLDPDLTLVLDLPADMAAARRIGAADRLESRDRDYHIRVREGFLAEARRRPDRIRVIDASRPIEAVHQEICREVLHVLEAGPRA
jgi:dTMP kinase